MLFSAKVKDKTRFEKQINLEVPIMLRSLADYECAQGRREGGGGGGGGGGPGGLLTLGPVIKHGARY